jgi:hypothetical protein
VAVTGRSSALQPPYQVEWGGGGVLKRGGTGDEEMSSFASSGCAGSLDNRGTFCLVSLVKSAMSCASVKGSGAGRVCGTIRSCAVRGLLEACEGRQRLT